MKILYSIYRLVMNILVWGVLVPWHVFQVLRETFAWSELLERLGRQQAPPRGNGRRVLVHAVSVGEVAAAAAILQTLSTEASSLDVFLTVGNREGREAAENLRAQRSDIRSVTFLPWDRASAMQSWLGRLCPDLVVVVETEIWPGLFLACSQVGIPLCIVNGRIYSGDVWRYRLVRPLLGRVLGGVDWIGVQDGVERERFIAIGAAPERVEVVGNAKFDAPRAPRLFDEEWRRRLGNTSLTLMAGSTHWPEERWMLECFGRIRPSFPGLRLVLAPRHPRRAKSLQRLVRKFQLQPALWSLPGPSVGWEVMILDQTGRLASGYAMADVAVVGGSFVPRGGHNILEAAAAGCAILVGPHSEHFQEIVERFAACGALRRLAGIDQLDAVLYALLTEEKSRKEMASKAMALVLDGRGVARSYARALRVRLGAQLCPDADGGGQDRADGQKRACAGDTRPRRQQKLPVEGMDYYDQRSQ